jgi:hypothetical protein
MAIKWLKGSKLVCFFVIMQHGEPSSVKIYFSKLAALKTNCPTVGTRQTVGHRYTLLKSKNKVLRAEN